MDHPDDPRRPRRIAEAYNESALQATLESGTTARTFEQSFGLAGWVVGLSLFAGGAYALLRAVGTLKPVRFRRISLPVALAAVALVALGIGAVRAGLPETASAVGSGLARSAAENKEGNSTLQIGLLDPIALTVRSMTTSVLPTAHMATEGVYTEPREYWFAWVVGLIFIGFLVANWWIPRFFCRAICPLGALLGIFSRFAIWRIDRDPVRCTDCDLCLKSCEGACDPHKDLRKSECFVCLNCIEDCPHDALSFRFLPRKESEVPAPDAGRRSVLLGGLFGLLFFPMVRKSGGVDKNWSPKAIRPPGSVAEDEFLRRCIKCDQCIRVCPTNVLQPSLFEAGLEGLWTPIMISKMGWCELNCTLCSQVCPTGAIREISIAEKLGTGPFEAKGPVKTGTAFYNRGRCLPWAMDTHCVVCEEVCPVSPKAIFTRNVEVVDRWGAKKELKRPYIDAEKCIGCGICEHECPVKDDPAVYVTAIGETRAKERTLLLSLVEDDVTARESICV